MWRLRLALARDYWDGDKLLAALALIVLVALVAFLAAKPPRRVVGYYEDEGTALQFHRPSPTPVTSPR